MRSRNWSRDELILAFNLYCRTPFGKIHNRNPEIILLARVLGRSPSSVSWKLANLARLDPSLKKRNIAGARHGGKLDEAVWDEFSSDWDALAFESERLVADKLGRKIEKSTDMDATDFPDRGKERNATVRVRVNQNFFRRAVLAAYDFRCCMTGLEVAELLVASHIVPWSVDIRNRVNPRNGLLLNSLHDRAFDLGLMTVTPRFIVRVSPRLKRLRQNSALIGQLVGMDGQSIRLPRKFIPESAFLRYHNRHVYLSS